MSAIIMIIIMIMVTEVVAWPLLTVFSSFTSSQHKLLLPTPNTARLLYSTQLTIHDTQFTVHTTKQPAQATAAKSP